MHTPGEHVIVIGTEADALRARADGLVLRDAITILLPGVEVLQAYLFRAPLEGTITSNVLCYEVGGLSIDACRVQAGGPSPSIRHRETARRTGHAPIPGTKAADAEARGKIERRGSFEAYATAKPGELLGRWPTNLLLVHGPGCKKSGERQVKGSVLHQVIERSKSKSNTYAGGKAQTDGYAHGYTSADGTETVAAWDCQPDCPVRMLDEMSGVTRNGGSVYGTVAPGGYHGGVGGKPTLFAGDSGTASRFYPQFACLEEALGWLQRLVGQEPPSV